MDARDYYRIWEPMLAYNDIETGSRQFSIYIFGTSLAAAYGALILLAGNPLLAFFGPIAAFIAVHGLVYSYLILGSNSRAGKVEEVLPDFLSLMASNIRSGLTPDKALIVSSRDEFGPLTSAINKAGKHSITGMSLEEVITGIGEHIHSNTLEKTVRLIVDGLHSGGDMAELLEKTALDLRKFRSVRSEVSSIILNYVLFIVAAVTLGAPMLYGVSTFLVDIMLAIKHKIGTGTAALSSISGSVGIFKGKLLLTSEGLVIFASASIVVTVFFGCMAVGSMSSGKRLEGLKYFPLLALVALAIMLGIRFGLLSVLGGMLK